jgi:hypothetical protein
MQRFLVIGATGVAGSAGIAAIRDHFSEAHITGVWFGRKEEELAIDGVNTVLFGDITDAAFLQRIEDSAGRQFDWCLYATALGDVGFPTSDATPEQISASNRISFDPLLMLEERFDLGAIVAYSTFYNLENQRITYGAMGHSKAAIEHWALTDGKSRHLCIRAGAFRSASSQGIKLLVRRRAKELAQSENPILRKFFSENKPSVAVELMEEAVFAEEREVYGDTHTDAVGLQAAHAQMFAGVDQPFINVCGKRIWLSSEPLPVG